MKSSARNCLLISLVTLFALSCSASGGGDILQSANSTQSLQERWTRGMAKGENSREQNVFWLGYSIEKWMGIHSSIGSHRGNDSTGRTTLAEILSGTETGGAVESVSGDEEIRIIAREELERMKDQQNREEKVLKKVALLYLFKNGNLADIKMSNLDLAVDLENKPLIWIGEAEDGESMALIRNIYQKEKSLEIKEDLVAAGAIHQENELTVDFLRDILRDEKSSEIREKAAFWMGQQDTPEALTELQTVIEKDPSEEVKESAVFGISQMDIPQAMDVLMNLAQTSRQQSVQEKAIFWLGQCDTERALPILKNIVFSAGSVEIKENAIFALSQLESEMALDFLIEIAKNHPLTDVRRKAIFWLGQKAGKKAEESLQEMVYSDEESEVQQHAVFAISQLPDEQSLPILEKIIKTHPDAGVRKKAIFWLGQIDDPKALEMLVDILDK